MANIEHIQILSQGAFVWNKWRAENPEIIPDFAGFNFARYKTEKDVPPSSSGGDGWIEHHWDYNSINFINVDLSDAILTDSIFSRKHFVKCNFSRADFSGSLLNDVLLKHSNFEQARLDNVNLKGATIAACDFRDATISNSFVFGISSWDRDATLTGAKQSNLIITKEDEAMVTVDDIQDANLIYNFYNNKTAGRAVDNLSTKLVFILGNFAPERKAVLDAIKTELRSHNFIPLLFDFDKPQNKNLKESVLLFANLSKFIIADLTDGRSVQRELEIITPNLTSVVIQPIILGQEKIYGMVDDDLLDFAQVLPLFRYDDTEHLIESIRSTLLPAIDEKINRLLRPKSN